MLAREWNVLTARLAAGGVALVSAFLPFLLAAVGKSSSGKVISLSRREKGAILLDWARLEP
jgi:hypothetical protein